MHQCYLYTVFHDGSSDKSSEVAEFGSECHKLGSIQISNAPGVIDTVIKLLGIEIAQDNIASFNTSKSLGFEYEGKIIKYKKINDEDRYISEHHFVKKMI